MKVLAPIEFQASQLVSTTAVETYSAYNAGTTYAEDAYVTYGTRIYQSLVGSNIGNQPDISPTFWIDSGPGNKYALFDNQVSTQTTATSPLNVTVNPGRAINGTAFLELEGTQLVVTMTDGSGGPTVYSNTIPLDDTVILDWYGYFFEEYQQRTEVILTDIPSYLNGILSFSLTGTSVKIGVFTYGTLYTLGGTQYGASVGIRDYSIKTTDDFGNTTFVQRAFSKRMDASVFMPNTSITANQKILTRVRATPCVWVGSEDSNMRPTVVYGFFRDFSIDISYPSYSMCRLEIEGLI